MSKIILINGTVITLDHENRIIENGAVLIEEDRITKIGISSDLLAKYKQDVIEIIDAEGGLILPGFINAHSHTYSAFAQGMPLEKKLPDNFLEILQKIWWKVDLALNEEDIYYSALISAIDAIKSGTTTIIDHHASPNSCANSLKRISEALIKVGLRGCLSYEVSDRNGEDSALEGIEENIRHIKWCDEKKNSLISASFGLHAPFTLSDDTLRICTKEEKKFKTGFHIHLAEGLDDVIDSTEKYKTTVTNRMKRRGILGEKTIAAHCIHLVKEDLDILYKTKTNIVHNPRSNMNNAVGVAPIIEMFDIGIRPGLGTDGMGMDMTREVYTSWLLQNHNKATPFSFSLDEAYQMLTYNNAKIASKFFTLKLGNLEIGNAADIIVIDYKLPTPLNRSNLFSHLLFGSETWIVKDTIINGKIVMKDRKIATINEPEVIKKTFKLASKLWDRIYQEKD
ncbi:putative aminohydrolase SsnA [subsurface metagenome]